MHRLECRLVAEAISVHQELYHRDDCRRDWSRLDLIEVWLIDWGASLPLDASRLCRNHRELVSCGDSTRNTPCLKPACIALAGLWRVGCTRFACCFSLKNFLFTTKHAYNSLPPNNTTFFLPLSTTFVVPHQTLPRNFTNQFFSLCKDRIWHQNNQSSFSFTHRCYPPH